MNEREAENSACQGISIREMPPTLPRSTDNARSDVLRADPSVLQMDDQRQDQSCIEEKLSATSEDRTRPSSNTQPSRLSTIMPINIQRSCSPGTEEENRLLSENQDYFTAKIAQSNALTHTTSSPATSPGPSSSTANDIGMRPELSGKEPLGPTPIVMNTRPVSVPNFSSTSLSRRREGPDYPNYPDQSFAALQNQHYPPPYKPSSPSMRSRSSQSSQILNFISSNNASVTDHPHATSGAKTVGSTPAQSPGLFSPSFPTNRTILDESGDSRSGTPTLHPTHLQTPKETHKLLKDVDPVSGRKTINHYEILRKLGSGQHGTVKLARNLDNGDLVAIKIVRRFSKKLRLGRSGDPYDMIKKEVAILKRLRHPHVVSLIEVIDDDEFGKVYLVLEFVERGEIVWRKQTDKDIAVFEMERTQREAAGNKDGDYELMAIDDFNIRAPQRRLDKLRRLEDQKRQANERVKNHGKQTHPGSNFWSLEFAGEIENENRRESPGHSLSRQGTKMQLGDEPSLGDSTYDSPQSETPTQTPRAHQNSADSGLPLSAPSSCPDTPLGVENTMERFRDEPKISDFVFQAALNEITTTQNHWSADEEVFRYVPCLTLSQALDAFRDTVLGLEYLHYQGIIHRDIKPANLLWTTDYRVKISDFGVSYLGKPIREDENKEEIPEADAAVFNEAIELAKTVGTPAFYAPELCDPHYFEVGRHPERPAITGQIDVWALGVTLYGIVFGRLPFFDVNEFQMYEKIAREEVFIPQMRLRGVEHTDKTPSNQNKRLDDVLEYEPVDDELRDLLKRLLNKHPSKRITLKEVKHHPWVLRGITNLPTWIDETDPSLQSQGRKIEVSTQEVQEAVIPFTVLDRVKAGVQRISSVLRGRSNRKRADSNSKATTDSSNSASATKSGANIKDARRTSLRGDEQIFTALRASREGSEHPLAQSVAASPEMRNNPSYFDTHGDAVRPATEPQIRRPSLPDRTLSTADSMKTIRPPVSQNVADNRMSSASSSPGAEVSTLTTVVEPGQVSSPGLLGNIGVAGRRFVNSMRSRERGTGFQSPSLSSRSSSADASTEDFHASPSLALSSAVAAGHVDQPPALREDVEDIPLANEFGAEPLHRLQSESISESIHGAQDETYRYATADSIQQRTRRSTVSTANELGFSPSADEAAFFVQQRPPSAAGSVTAFQVSSSSDQIVSGESTAHSRIPSIVSRASSLSATIEEEEQQSQRYTLEKSISPLTMGRRSVSQSRESASNEDLNPQPALAKAAAEEEAGYNGEGEQDSDSDDEGLAMA